jgi:hypothetical protein
MFSWQPIGKREAFHLAPAEVGGSDLSLKEIETARRNRQTVRGADHWGGGGGMVPVRTWGRRSSQGRN